MTATAQQASPQFIEPTSRLALTWGNYRTRYGLGLGLILASLIVPSLINAISVIGNSDTGLGPVIIFQLVRFVFGFAGLITLPASPRGRSIALILAGVLALLSVVGTALSFNGAHGLAGILGLLTAPLPLLIWFVIRQRPGLSYLMLIPAVLVGFSYVVSLFTTDIPTYVVLEAVIRITLLVGPAWAGRGIAVAVAGSVARSEARSQQDMEQRAAEIKRWEDAYALAHNGERPPAGVLPVATPFGSNSGKTNTLAILSLVFSLIATGVVGVILGHLSLSQIKRTGEAGRGLAVAGLVIGYIGIAGGVILSILYVAVLSRSLY